MLLIPCDGLCGSTGQVDAALSWPGQPIELVWTCWRCLGLAKSAGAPIKALNVRRR